MNLAIPTRRSLGQTPIDPYSLPLTWESMPVAEASTTGASITSGLVSAGVTLGVSAAVSGVLYGIRQWRQGVQRRGASTAIVNDAEPWLQRNLQAYLESPRTVSDQAAAIEGFYSVWNQVVDACRKVGGNAGRACIEDRQEGSTKFSWGNWFTAYLDPIRFDENVVPDPEPGQVYNVETGEFETPAGAVSVPLLGALPVWLVAAGVGVVGLLVLGGSK